MFTLIWALCPASQGAVPLGLCFAQLRLPRSCVQALNETLAPHLKNKTAFHKDRQLPGQSYHAQISQFTKLASLSHTHTHTETVILERDASAWCVCVCVCVCACVTIVVSLSKMCVRGSYRSVSRKFSHRGDYENSMRILRLAVWACFISNILSWL